MPGSAPLSAKPRASRPSDAWMPAAPGAPPSSPRPTSGTVAEYTVLEAGSYSAEAVAVELDLGIAGGRLQLQPRTAVAGHPEAPFGAREQAGCRPPRGSAAESTRRLWNSIRPLTPAGAGAASASWTAWASGLAGGGASASEREAMATAAPASTSTTAVAWMRILGRERVMWPPYGRALRVP